MPANDDLRSFRWFAIEPFRITIPAAAGHCWLASPGATAYAEHCAICHGDNREGDLPAFSASARINRQMMISKSRILSAAAEAGCPDSRSYGRMS